MKTKIAASTWQALKDEGFQLDDSYSGRGMYGVGCVGVTGRLGDMLRFVAVLVSYCDDPGDAADLCDELGRVAATDSMGTETIYYFPGWTVGE